MKRRILLLSSNDIEQQLITRRLEIQELQRTISELRGSVKNNTSNIESITNIKAINVKPNPVAQGESLDSFFNGDSVIHKLKHTFNLIVSFLQSINLPSLTASRPLKVDSSGNVISDLIALDSASDVKNILPVANGGTAQNSLANHKILIGNDTSAVKLLTPGDSGKILKSNGTGADPDYDFLCDTYLYQTGSGGYGPSNLQKGGAVLVSGLYQLAYTLSMVPTGAASVTLQITWTDSFGQAWNQSRVLSGSSLNRDNLSFYLDLNGVNNLTVQISITGVTNWYLHLAVIKLH